jgi:hypothetical protein
LEQPFRSRGGPGEAPHAADPGDADRLPRKEFSAMPLLFSYGTLQQDNVQLSTFGRLLHGHTDELVGFESAIVQIEDP